MGTSGIGLVRDLGAAQEVDQTMVNATLIALLPASGTASIWTVTITAPTRHRFDSAVTTAGSGASIE